MQAELEQPMTVLHGMTALAVSAAICHAAHLIADAFSLAGMSIPIATALSVLVATLFPAALRPLTSSAEGLAAILMQVCLLSRQCCVSNFATVPNDRYIFEGNETHALTCHARCHALARVCVPASSVAPVNSNAGGGGSGDGSSGGGSGCGVVVNT